ncbi:MAG: hypothetical protein LBE85_10640, partial [Candidatus Accumulibacter sp.]|nr:hypothetical protein [Accumulibacter sp.]
MRRAIAFGFCKETDKAITSWSILLNFGAGKDRLNFEPKIRLPPVTPAIARIRHLRMRSPCSRADAGNAAGRVRWPVLSFEIHFP